MENTIPDRYEKNPMLVLAENFILDAIGKLETEKIEKLNQIICRTFGGTDWRQTFREQLQLPPDTAATLMTLWKRCQEEGELKQVDVTPEIFAQQTADELFADMGS